MIVTYGDICHCCIHIKLIESELRDSYATQKTVSGTNIKFYYCSDLS